MNDNAQYQKLIKKQMKHALSKDKEMFKDLECIKHDANEKLVGELGEHGFHVSFKVDPSGKHDVALRIKVIVESQDDAEIARNALADVFNEEILYKISCIPLLWGDGYEVVYTIMSDDYYFKPQLGRDY